MDAQSLQHLLARFDLLTVKQRSIVQRFLQISVQRDGLEEVLPDLKACPHCAADAAPIPQARRRGQGVSALY